MSRFLHFDQTRLVFKVYTNSDFKSRLCLILGIFSLDFYPGFSVIRGIILN